MSAHLSPELRAQKGFRSLPIREKDEVIIMRGKYKGVKGKITSVNYKYQYVIVDKAVRKESENKAEVAAKLHPSNLMIVKIAKHKDKRRIRLMNRRTTIEDAKIDPNDIEDEDDFIDIDDEELDQIDAEIEDIEAETEDIETVDAPTTDAEEEAETE